MSAFEPAFAPEHVRTEGWDLWMSSPARGVFVSRASGHLDLAAAKALFDRFDQVMAQHTPVLGFHDWRKVTGYDAEARQEYVRRVKGRPPEVALVHVLVGSKLLAMGAQVVKLLVGSTLTVYSDEAPFGHARAAALASRR